MLVRNINTLENQKFVECEDGNTAVRTFICNGVVVTPSGLNIAGKITEVTLSSGAWTALPPTPLTDRNAISIQNLSGIEIKVNYDNAEAGYKGMVISQGSERFYDITDQVVVYAKSASGTPTVTVEEIS